jgi:hypothetical protein
MTQASGSRGFDSLRLVGTNMDQCAVGWLRFDCHQRQISG